MKSIALQAHVGADGILELNVPVEVKETNLEVLVVMQPIESQETVEVTNGSARDESQNGQAVDVMATFGICREDDSLPEIFEEINRQRHADAGREITVP